MTRCAKKDCTETGIWAPIMVLWPLGYPRTRCTPARGHIFPKDVNGETFLLCHKHKAEARFSDIIPTSEWTRLLAFFAAAGKAEPDLETASLDWEAVQ